MPKPTATELIERIDEILQYKKLLNHNVTSSIGRVDFMETFEQARAHINDPWISVEERLPEDYEPVSFHDGDSVFSGYRSRLHGSWYRPETESYIGNVTHWCPLPPLPKKAGEE